MRKAFIKTLVELARKDKDIYLIVADLGYSVVEPFFNEFPERSINAGISEQNAIGMAAGLALSGKKVFVYSIIPFITMRCYEQIRIDVVYQKLNVKIVGIGSGVMYGSAGTTHHALEDIAIMRVLPGMTICTPSDSNSLRLLLIESMKSGNPWYFRLGKDEYNNMNSDGSLPFQLFNEKGNCLIVTTGTMANYVQTNLLSDLRESGIDSAFLVYNIISPLNTDVIIDYIKKKKPIIVIEDHFSAGGLYSSLLEELVRKECDCSIIRGVGFGNDYCHHVMNSDSLTGAMIKKEWFDAKLFIKKKLL